MKTQEVTTPITDTAQAIQERITGVPGMDQLKAIGSRAIEPFQAEQKHSWYRPRNIIIGGIALGAAGIAYSKKFIKQAPFGESEAYRRAAATQGTELADLRDEVADQSQGRAKPAPYPEEDRPPGATADIDQTEAQQRQDSF